MCVLHIKLLFPPAHLDPAHPVFELMPHRETTSVVVSYGDRDTVLRVANTARGDLASYSTSRNEHAGANENMQASKTRQLFAAKTKK